MGLQDLISSGEGRGEVELLDGPVGELDSSVLALFLDWYNGDSGFAGFGRCW